MWSSEKRLTWEELAQHLANDYEGAEDVRLMLKNIARYGDGRLARRRVGQARVRALYAPGARHAHAARATP